MSALVFIDSNVVKFSSTELVRLRPQKEQVQWGPTVIEVVVHDEVIVNPNEKISNPELRTEADLLPQVASLGTTGALEFVQTVESLYETWGLPALDSESGRFYGSTIRLLKDIPFKYGRVMGGLGVDGKAEQVRFISSIANTRFTELKRACGAHQGSDRPFNRNQLLDAYHVWCAELAGCCYFLTLDFKLQRTLAHSKISPQVLVVRPSELLRALEPPRTAVKGESNPSLNSTPSGARLGPLWAS